MKLGIDLGGTKIEIIALDNHGNTLLRQRVATPQQDYQATLQAIKNLIQTTEKEIADTGTIGICTPGAISPATELLKNSNSTCLNGQPIKQDLEKLLQREIRISNDANCFALSEAIDGAAKDANIVFGVIIGTGTGAGVIINQQALIGANAIAGEWGHNPLPWANENELSGLDCYCGKQGCIETYLSGSGLARQYQARTGIKLSAEQIVKQTEQGGNDCEQELQRYEQRLAKSLAHVINILDPDVIVLGGGMSNIQRLYQNVPKYWGDYIFSDYINTRLLPPVYGDSSGVRGAAWLW